MLELLSAPPSRLDITSFIFSQSPASPLPARSLISTLNNEMESSSNGLLQKMKLQNFSEDIIARLFTDLLIAAGDTVSFLRQIAMKCQQSSQNLLNFSSQLK